MAVEPQDAARFGRSSPVLRHWLAHSHGFVVRGLRGRGVVVKVYGLPGAPQTILVRTRYSRRRLRIPADAFDEVVPANKELVVRNTLRRATRGEPRQGQVEQPPRGSRGSHGRRRGTARRPPRAPCYGRREPAGVKRLRSRTEPSRRARLGSSADAGAAARWSAWPWTTAWEAASASSHELGAPRPPRGSAARRERASAPPRRRRRSSATGRSSISACR